MVNGKDFGLGAPQMASKWLEAYEFALGCDFSGNLNESLLKVRIRRRVFQISQAAVPLIWRNEIPIGQLMWHGNKALKWTATIFVPFFSAL